MIWSFLRRRVFPWSVWAVVMITAARLWFDLHVGATRGYVESTSYDVTTPLIGRVESLSVEVGQRVRAGDVIAIIDAGEVTAELAMLAAERGRIEAELAAVASSTRVEIGESSREIEESVEAAEIAEQTARAERSVRAAELAALDEQLKLVRDLVDKRMADRRDLVELEVTHAALAKELQQADGLVRRLSTQVASTRTRRAVVPADAVDRATDPLIAELQVVRREEQMLAVRKESLTLRAPGDGEVTAVFLRPGQVALPGVPVANITGPVGATSGGAPLVVVCMDQERAEHVRVGEAVELAAPDGWGDTMPGRVERLASEVAQLPARCWRDPRIPEWGRPAWVAPHAPVPLLAGQAFTVAFLGHMSSADPVPSAGTVGPVSDAAPEVSITRTSRPSGPTHMLVQPTLLARTRFEPSGVVWSPALKRFVVVSDDTGLPNVDEHAPWLFTMDETGRVDPRPLVVAGLKAMRDLESIAPAPDGGLYVLSSQSSSKKGKRTKTRECLVHISLDGGQATATRTVYLAELLDAAGADTRAALGLGSTSALEIEGLTTTAEGGLLLGLKSPLDADGNAIIWHLRDPDQLLATGELAAGRLTRWGGLRLAVTAAGSSVPGGISELLELGDGTLLVASTPSAANAPTDQIGALVSVAGRAGLASPRLVREFPGLRPEGLARTPDDDGIMIVFDAGADTPSWMELPWPVK